ncbi:protein of unknown function [Pararobbsia alpina]
MQAARSSGFIVANISLHKINYAVICCGTQVEMSYLAQIEMSHPGRFRRMLAVFSALGDDHGSTRIDHHEHERVRSSQGHSGGRRRPADAVACCRAARYQPTSDRATDQALPSRRRHGAHVSASRSPEQSSFA